MNDIKCNLKYIKKYDLESDRRLLLRVRECRFPYRKIDIQVYSEISCLPSHVVRQVLSTGYTTMTWIEVVTKLYKLGDEGMVRILLEHIKNQKVKEHIQNVDKNISKDLTSLSKEVNITEQAFKLARR